MLFGDDVDRRFHDRIAALGNAFAIAGQASLSS
jgi:hypothetical protein